MLKKTILESPTSIPNNENISIKSEMPKSATLQGQRASRDLTQKLLSPISQQDTTSDSMIRMIPNDIAKNTVTLQRKEFSQLLSQYQIDASVIDKLQSKC